MATIILLRHFPGTLGAGRESFSNPSCGTQRNPASRNLPCTFHHARSWDHTFFGPNASNPDVCAYTLCLGSSFRCLKVWSGVGRLKVLLFLSSFCKLHFSVDQNAQDTYRCSAYGTRDGGSALNQLPHSLSLSAFFTIVPPQVAAYGSRLILIECQHFLLSWFGKLI